MHQHFPLTAHKDLTHHASNSTEHQNIPPHYSSLEDSNLQSAAQKDHCSTSEPTLPHYENIERVSTAAVKFQISDEGQATNQLEHPELTYQKQDRKRLLAIPSQDSVDSNSLAPNSVRDEESIGFEYPPNASAGQDGYNSQKINLASARNNDSVDLPPLDPYLVCPTCAINFRVGEIQEFRKHFLDCKRLKESSQSASQP